MSITYDPAKRRETLIERGLDFEDSEFVFAAPNLEVEDTRREYGENRMICYGQLAGRMVVVGYVQRGEDRQIFSMRKANERRRAAPRRSPPGGSGAKRRSGGT